MTTPLPGSATAVLPGGPVRWATKTDVAYRSLRARILDGTLAPGSVVEQEALAASLGLSTTPVREALRRLEAEGLLTQVAHRAIRVPGLSRTELDELYAVRLEMDPFGAQLGARAANDALRAHLRTLVAPVDRDGYLERNRELHRAMYVASGNSVLIELLDRLWERAERYRIVLLRDTHIADTAHAEHTELVEAFCAGDTEELARLLREHLRGSHRELTERIG
jgi:DNA-binding GntR family transcriptional regulator